MNSHDINLLESLKYFEGNNMYPTVGQYQDEIYSIFSELTRNLEEIFDSTQLLNDVDTLYNIESEFVNMLETSRNLIDNLN